MNFNIVLAKSKFLLRKYTPEIAIGGSVIALGGTVYTTARSTMKLEPVLDEAKTLVDQIHVCTEQEIDGYTKEDSRKDLFKVYLRTGAKIVKLYLPTIICAGLNIAGMLTSNRVLRNREFATATALAASQFAFDKYRQAVVEKYGEDVDYELRYPMVEEKVKEVIVNKNGKEQTVTKNVKRPIPEGYSEHAFVFDEFNPNWKPSPDANRTFLEGVEKTLQEQFKSNGYITGNDIRKALAAKVYSAGQICGKIYDENDESRDNGIDLGFRRSKRFMEGNEASVWLDPNLDVGTIYEKIDEIADW